MASLVKTVEIDILAKDGDAEAKLDAISAKADKLREEHPELTIRIDTAEASAKMAIFREELKAATRPIDEEIKVKVDKHALAESEAELGVFSRLLESSGLGGSGNSTGFLSSLDELPYGGLPALAAALPVIGALLVELTGLVSGFAAAGAGLGAFGALAYPTLKKIETAYTGISTAQAAYHAAVQLEAKDPTTTNATAVKTALAQLKIAEDNLSPSTRQAITGIDKLKSTYEKMATAFQPIVMKVFNDGLKVANDLLPTLKTPATDFGNAIGGLLTQLGKFTQSKGFADWLDKFDKLIGPSTTAIGVGLGHVVNSFGKLITVLSGKDVVNSINIAFRVLSGTLGGLTYVVQHIAGSFSSFTSMIAKSWHIVQDAVAAFVSGNRLLLGRAISDVEHWVSVVSTDTGKVVAWFKALPGRIMSAIGNLGSLLFRAGANAISGLISGMGSMVGRAISDAENWGHDIVSAIGSPFGIHFSEPSQATKMIKAGQNIALGLSTGIRSGTSAVSASSSALAAAAGIGAGSGGSRALQLRVSVAGGADASLATALMKLLRFEIVQVGGGGSNSVQRALGQTA